MRRARKITLSQNNICGFQQNPHSKSAKFNLPYTDY